MKKILILFTILLTTGCSHIGQSTQEQIIMLNKNEKLTKATFAGGCFWCMEGPFETMDGIEEVISGYTGGEKNSPTYSEVSTGKTGHTEAVQIFYDPEKIDYNLLLNTFWTQIDPTDDGGQFADRGTQYKTAIYYHTDKQKELAEKSKQALKESGKFDKPIVTKILPSEDFYLAEEDHQDFYKKSADYYKQYKKGSGRSDFLEKIWGDKTATPPKENKEDLKDKLTQLQYDVTQQCSTEPAFNNEYWDNKAEGIYVDIVSGEPLFSSLDKFDSGTGWPSFTKPLDETEITQNEDSTLGIKRVEVKGKDSGSHLGHIFDDGPKESGGQRYCINSASLKFISKEYLEKEGYEDYLKIFK